ncbi:MAG: PAS domain S-box protein [Deltaproteobacteria bacterium]|nr:PAS domain S-box protein [Deltaproteobacteria bacterium]MBW2416202.1 PAS domain S-box protein [Deltaproteobacteria bacterium]
MDGRQQDWWSIGEQAPQGPLHALRRRFVSVPMPLFLQVVVPMTLVFLLGFVFEYRARVGAEEARLVTQETSVIQRGVHRVERELAIASADLHFVADLVGDIFDDDSTGRVAALERSLLAFARRRPGYFQLRFIGATGREVLRIEQAADGPRLTPADELQDKRDRSYFTGTIRLQPGDLFVSPMELNVEHGAIEEPYKPVVRLATPVEDAAGRLRGVVVLNVRGGQFLRGFERSADDAGIQRMIVNSEGYWLRHRPDVEWGFALEHRRSFARTFPEVWEEFQAAPQGRAESDDGLFYFDTVQTRGQTAGREVDAPGVNYWMFISVIPRELLDDVAVRIATPLLVTAIPFYIAVLALGWFVGSALQRRRLADEALRNLEQVRGAMMNAALEAIIVMNEEGFALEFNPAAQRIFGYTLEEARGRLVADLIIPPSYRETHRKSLEHYLATGEGRIIDKHVDNLTGIRKSGEEFPVELTVCPIMVAGTRFFYGFLRDLSESGRRAVQADPPGSPAAVPGGAL